MFVVLSINQIKSCGIITSCFVNLGSSLFSFAFWIPISVTVLSTAAFFYIFHRLVHQMVNLTIIHLYLCMSSSCLSFLSSLLIVVLYRVLNPRNVIHKYIFFLAIADVLLSFFIFIDAAFALSDQIRTVAFCQIIGALKVSSGLSSWCWTAIIAWHCHSPKENFEKKVVIFSCVYPAIVGIIVGSLQQMTARPDYLYKLSSP